MRSTRTTRLIHVAFHILVWSIYLLLPYVVSTSANDYKIGIVPGQLFTLMGLIHMAIFYGNAFVLYPIWLNRRFWWLYLLASIGLIFLSFQLKRQLLIVWFPDVIQDKNAYKFIFGPSIAFFFISLIYRNIIDQIKTDQLQTQQRAEQLTAELKFLRSQISPHFLFNVLTNLVSLARQGSNQLEPSLLMLSDLMRYMLYDVQGRRIALRKEVNYLVSYIELQKLRFSNDILIKSQINIQEDDYFCEIEPMLLIPFVENAFKHGVGFTEDPQIVINLSVNEKRLVFDVQNTWDSQSELSQDQTSGIGLSNLRARLNLLYRNAHTLTITSTNNWFHTTLTLNLA